MNRVFHNQLHKARGLVFFSNAETGLIVLVGGVGYLFVSLVAGIVVGILVAVALIVHRRLDNHRLDHLEILARKLGMARPDSFNLCERDLKYERFAHRFPRRD